MFLDEAVGPYAAHEIVGTHHGAARVDQRQEHVERPPADLDRPSIRQQFATIADHLEPAEFADCPRLRRGRHGQTRLYRHVSELFRTNETRSGRPSRTLSPCLTDREGSDS